MKKMYNVTIVNGETARTEKVTANSKRDKIIKTLAINEGDEIVKIEDVTLDIAGITNKLLKSELFTADEKTVLIESL